MSPSRPPGGTTPLRAANSGVVTLLRRPQSVAEPQVRLLIVPGLHGSGPGHWQSWLEQRYPTAVRIALDDWGLADLGRWSRAIDEVLNRERADAWIAVTHSFGCLALANYVAQHKSAIQGALMVAPANPDRFVLDEDPIARALPFASTLVVSTNDPWMSHADALYFGRRWGSEIIDAGDAGHINSAAGYGPWPEAAGWVGQHVQRVAAAVPPRVWETAPALGFAI